MAESDYEELRERLKPMLVERFTEANEGMRYLTSGRFSHGDPEQNAEGILELVWPLIEAELRKRDADWEGQARDWLRAIDEQGKQLEQSRQREAEALKHLEFWFPEPAYISRRGDAPRCIRCARTEIEPHENWCEHPATKAFLESQKGGGRPAHGEERTQRSFRSGLPVTGEAEVSP